MDATYASVLNTIINAGISLVIAFGTWHISMKQDRKKQTEEVKVMLTDHREEYLSGIQDVKDEVASLKTAVEINQAVTDGKIDTLSKNVEKHNGIYDKTVQLQQDVALHEEKIKVANHRIDDLEQKVR